VISPTVAFALPDGQVLHLDRTNARRAADRLWELSARPGAVVCATIITEALRQSVAHAIQMRPREADALTAVLTEL
jgi:hypothetical protein